MQKTSLPEPTAAADSAIEAARLHKRAELGRALALLKEARTIAGAESADDPEPGEPI